MNRSVLPALALAALIAPAAAQAASPAVALATVNLRAGPGTNYPVVRSVPAGARLTTFGCNASFSWCDVSWGPNRGWMSASRIQIVYAGRPVIVTPAAAVGAGLAVVAFNQAYWSTHYVGRPWYGSWNRYAPAYGRAGGIACGPNACRYGVVRHGPYGTTVRHGRFWRR